MDELHVFENEAGESVIAYNPDDAIKVWEETVGDKYDTEELGRFDQVLDASLYTLYEEETVNPSPVPAGAILVSSGEFHHSYKATCRAWADAHGRCYLGSMDY